MKRIFTIVLACIMILCLFSCNSGKVSNVSIKEFESTLYTTEEIEAAINVAIDYFKKEFSGCTLNEITYAGDEMAKKETEYYAAEDGDEVIVLISEFDVDSSGGDGSLNPNSTYKGWKWILVRSNAGEWRHLTHGYG